MSRAIRGRLRGMLFPRWRKSPRDGEQLSRLRQGTLLAGFDLPVVIRGLIGLAEFEAVHGLVVISQTCDLIQVASRTAVVAPLVTLDTDMRAHALRRSSPRYVPVQYASSDEMDYFVDLDHLATVDKAVLAQLEPIADLPTEQAEREFRRDLGRRSTRFAFPDDVVPWFKPLMDIAYDKKGTSPEGRVLSKVTELRVESANGWLHPPYQLVLTVIVGAGELPTFPGDEIPPMPPELHRRIRRGGRPAASGQIAEMLDTSSESAEKYYLWQAIGDAWAERCRPKEAYLRRLPEDEAIAVQAAVADGAVLGDVISIDEYSLARYYRSELLDLAHLSDPR